MQWILKTAGQRWEQEASTFQDAIRIAWKKRPPKSVGFLVEGSLATNASEATTLYTTGEKALGRAGFSVEERTAPK